MLDANWNNILSQIRAAFAHDKSRQLLLQIRTALLIEASFTSQGYSHEN